MYKILSLPTEVEGAERIIRAAYDIAVPPNFEDWFDERAFRYAQFGIAAYNISEELSKKYGIQMKIYQDWNPVEELKFQLEAIQKRHQKRMEIHSNSINRILRKNRCLYLRSSNSFFYLFFFIYTIKDCQGCVLF